MTRHAKLSLFLAFSTSAAVHGAAYASLSAEHLKPPRASERSQMNFELLPAPVPSPAPEPELAPVSKGQARGGPPAGVQQALPSNQPASATPIPAKAEVAPALDLSGITLTNDTGAGFAMPVGDGSALRGPIVLGANRVQAVVAPSAAPKRPALVDASDLSEHPKPPTLTGLLRANYPEQARQRGLGGSASLRARIDADGVIRGARLLSESSAGFGSACRRTLLGSHWSAPRDKNGRAVATEIVYTCHFEVDQ